MKGQSCSSTRSQRPHDSGEIVKILFDQGMPVPLRQHLAGHSVDTASEKAWSDLDSGDLIDLAEQEGYEAFVTTDQGMRYQQNLAAKRLAIVVLLSTAWPEIQHRIGEIRTVVVEIQPGELQEVRI